MKAATDVRAKRARRVTAIGQPQPRDRSKPPWLLHAVGGDADAQASDAKGRLSARPAPASAETNAIGARVTAFARDAALVHTSQLPTATSAERGMNAMARHGATTPVNSVHSGFSRSASARMTAA
jgi:hypothetical protein